MTRLVSSIHHSPALFSRACIPYMIRASCGCRAMLMKGYRILMPGCFLAMILLGACASSEPIPLPADFWNRERLSIGVVLGKVSEPKVKTGPSLFGRNLPFDELLAGGGEEYDQIYEPGDRGEPGDKPFERGEQAGSRQYGSAARGYPAPSVKAGNLEDNLKAMGTGLLLPVQKSFVKRLEHAGWHVVPLQGPLGDDYHNAEDIKAYDVLIIIDCDWYGIHCRPRGSGSVPTFALTDMHARMIDLKDDKLLWQSPREKKGTVVSCMCDEQDCFPVIRSALQKSVNRAGEALIADLLKNQP